VNELVARVAAFFVQLGVIGLVMMGILNSSFLVLPMGHDLLLLGLAASHPERIPLYVAASAAGSAIGVALVDFISRKGGEKGLEKVMKPRQIERLKKKIAGRAAVMLIAASLAPPPFPFTAVIAGTSALQYPRARLLTLVLFARALRFLLVSLIAVWWGTGVLNMIRSQQFQWFLIGFTVFCLVASVISVARWLKRTIY
jgi:membrane protein YqaA with SNARE-associated domain